jgi:hypothetical protein
MTFTARVASLTLLVTTVAVPMVDAQSRSGAVSVQVQVLPTCGISVEQRDNSPRAELSCAGTSQRAVRLKVGSSATTVPLVSTGNSRASAELNLPGADDTDLITIQF